MTLNASYDNSNMCTPTKIDYSFTYLVFTGFRSLRGKLVECLPSPTACHLPRPEQRGIQTRYRHPESREANRRSAQIISVRGVLHAFLDTGIFQKATKMHTSPMIQEIIELFPRQHLFAPFFLHGISSNTNSLFLKCFGSYLSQKRHDPLYDERLTHKTRPLTLSGYFVCRFLSLREPWVISDYQARHY